MKSTIIVEEENMVIIDQIKPEKNKKEDFDELDVIEDEVRLSLCMKPTQSNFEIIDETDYDFEMRKCNQLLSSLQL